MRRDGTECDAVNRCKGELVFSFSWTGSALQSLCGSSQAITPWPSFCKVSILLLERYDFAASERTMAVCDAANECVARGPLTSGSIGPSSVVVVPSLSNGQVASTLDLHRRCAVWKYRWLRGCVSQGSTASGGRMTPPGSYFGSRSDAGSRLW